MFAFTPNANWKTSPIFPYCEEFSMEISTALSSQFGTVVEIVSIYFAESVNPVLYFLNEILHVVG